MKYSGKLTLVFLLALYIGPILFISSYGHTAILAEPNTIKDFAPASEWYNESWEYRCGISITGSVGAGTDYQILITVPYAAHMQTDFDDLLFTDDNGITELDYWIESYVASTSAVVWVEVADDLDSNQVIYMYSGNDEVSTTSDGDTTFLLFDDFNDDSKNTTKWDSSVGTTEAGGYLSVPISGQWFGSVAHFQSGTAIEARTKQVGQQKHNMGYGNTWPVTNPQWINHAFGGDTFMY